ncbi:DUF6776 family protein [Hylemonella sp. W303a]|uniref:DUF6776 family protein n=1 Tax=Hylemonella sp. W303a TaxID=3389873 RepID=UPI00396B2023
MRLLLRRLTVSAPRMSVRSSLPWPLRWVIAAVTFGFCAAIGLWAFEFGRDIAGIEGGSAGYVEKLEQQLSELRSQARSMKDERDEALAKANTASTLMAAEQAAQERLTELNRQLEADNQRLRDDLGFFERLIPTEGGSEALAIRGLQAVVQQDGQGQQVKWQVLVIQPQKNAREFSGQLEVQFIGVQSGRPWSAPLPQGAQPIRLRQYARAEGTFQLPPDTEIRSISAKVMQGDAVRAEQSVKL